MKPKHLAANVAAPSILRHALAVALSDRTKAMPAGFEDQASAPLFPSRRRGALLPWEALKNALHHDAHLTISSSSRRGGLPAGRLR